MHKNFGGNRFSLKRFRSGKPHNRKRKMTALFLGAQTQRSGSQDSE